MSFDISGIVNIIMQLLPLVIILTLLPTILSAFKGV
jgi:hypothetical protein